MMDPIDQDIFKGDDEARRNIRVIEESGSHQRGGNPGLPLGRVVNTQEVASPTGNDNAAETDSRTSKNSDMKQSGAAHIRKATAGLRVPTTVPQENSIQMNGVSRPSFPSCASRPPHDDQCLGPNIAAAAAAAAASCTLDAAVSRKRKRTGISNSRSSTLDVSNKKRHHVDEHIGKALAMVGFKSPPKHAVLLGRGRLQNEHPGNLQYRVILAAAVQKEMENYHSPDLLLRASSYCCIEERSSEKVRGIMLFPNRSTTTDRSLTFSWHHHSNEDNGMSEQGPRTRLLAKEEGVHSSTTTNILLLLDNKKHWIAERVADSVRQHGFRFMKKGSDSLWYYVHDRNIEIEKAKQAFRDEKRYKLEQHQRKKQASSTPRVVRLRAEERTTRASYCSAIATHTDMGTRRSSEVASLSSFSLPSSSYEASSNTKMTNRQTEQQQSAHRSGEQPESMAAPSIMHQLRNNAVKNDGAASKTRATTTNLVEGHDGVSSKTATIIPESSNDDGEGMRKVESTTAIESVKSARTIITETHQKTTCARSTDETTRIASKHITTIQQMMHHCQTKLNQAIHVMEQEMTRSAAAAAATLSGENTSGSRSSRHREGQRTIEFPTLYCGNDEDRSTSSQFQHAIARESGDETKVLLLEEQPYDYNDDDSEQDEEEYNCYRHRDTDANPPRRTEVVLLQKFVQAMKERLRSLRERHTQTLATLNDELLKDFSFLIRHRHQAHSCFMAIPII